MKTKEKRGITLVALVVTIVVLLILAGISICALTNTGIFEKVKEAKKRAEDAQKEQEEMLYKYEDELNKNSSNDNWDGKINKPELMTGMNAINFIFNESMDEYEINTENIDINNENEYWYNYDEKKWANAQTEDGSMWVWIPRFAYKVVYNDSMDKSKGGTFDIVFLIGTTDNYYDKDGKLQTAQRQMTKEQKIETDLTKTDKYTVHPAFTNESSIDYANGGWKKELTGIWVAKFEAGYFNKDTEKDKIKSSNVNYTKAYVYSRYGENIEARNYYDGVYGVKNGNNFSIIDGKKVFVKYPTFQGLKYSMNYIGTIETFNISRSLTDKDNIYGFDDKETDSHLMKNSEWGVVTYLSQSKYGLNDKSIIPNSVCVDDDEKNVYAITGYATKIESGEKKSYEWNKKEGNNASTTGTIYGVYDLAGGVWERMASIVNIEIEEKSEYKIYNILKDQNSTEYITVYPKGAESNSFSNFSVNKLKGTYGDALNETTEKSEKNIMTWFNNYFGYPGTTPPFFRRWELS